MKEVLDKLFKDLEEASREVSKIKSAIKALQNVCEHNEKSFNEYPWRYDGHGHNYSVYICCICKVDKEH
jgi:hypothetical protein